MSFLARNFLLSLVLWGMLPKTWAALPESEVRAAIIVNFVHYVEWPDNPTPTSEMLICVAGQGPTVDALLAYDGKAVYGRRILVESRPHASANCRLLFIGETSIRSAGDWLRDVVGHPVLTVSEGDDFLSNGGIISLNRNGSRIAFDVNLAAMRHAGLRIGSPLLRLARDIHGK